MRHYGANKATEFTRKQIGVIFANAKQGNIRVEKWLMSELYNLADYYGYDHNGSVERDEAHVLKILDYVFSGDTEKAQAEIDWFADHTFNLFSEKRKASVDRNVTV